MLRYSAALFCLLMLRITYGLRGLSVLPMSSVKKRLAMSKAVETRVATKKRTALVAVADGSEEIETVTIVDVLVRAGVDVTLASVTSNLNVQCSRGVKLVSDRLIAECMNQSWDAVICPGGMPGANHLRDSADLIRLLRNQQEHDRIVAAICAAPAVVLATHYFLNGKQATGYPAEKFVSMIADYMPDRVVVDGKLITSQGPGTAMAFSLKIAEALCGEEKAAQVKAELLCE